MAGKSLEQVTKEIQSRMAEERNRRQSHEKALLEQSEKSRREYVERMRLLEANSPSSAASSAAAGAGAGAGGSGNRDKIYPTTFKQSHLVHWVEESTDLQKIRIYNYTDGQFAAEFDTGLLGIDWIVSTDLHVQTAGFSIAYQNANDSTYRIFFFNAEGTHLATKSLDEFEDFQYTENAICYLGGLAGVTTAYHFDGHNVWTHTFEDNLNDVEVDDGSEDDCTADGSMIIDIANTKYYIMRPDGSLKNISEYMTGVGNGYSLDYFRDYIAARKQDNTLINIVGQEGNLVNSFDLSDFNIDYLSTSSFYGDKSMFWYYNLMTGNDKLVVTYNGVEDRFVYVTYSLTTSELTEYHEWTWFNPESSNGESFVISHYDYVVQDSIGYVCTNLKFTWLPENGTEFLTGDFSSYGTVSIVDGFMNMLGYRSFSLGYTPIVMIGRENGEIEVCQLGTSGAFTYSTGILSASCSNIWGGPMRQYNWAVFDVGSDRIFQIYGEGQVLEEFTTGQNWTVGHLGYNVNRYGTLAVMDTVAPSNNKFYSDELGLIPGPTGVGNVYNEVDYGSRVGHSFPEQVITQYVPGEENNVYVHGFHVLRLDGVSDFVEFTAGTSSTFQMPSQYDVKFGDDIIAFRLTDAITSEVTVAVYNKTSLDLVYEENIGMTASTSIWHDRVLINKTVGNNLDMVFVSLDVNTLNVQQTGYGYESNDVVDNDV